MKQASKVKEALKRRIAVWDALVARDMRGTTTKMVQRNDGTRNIAFHRPGSQNPKKGRSGRSAKR
jgi:hypothetical protein